MFFIFHCRNRLVFIWWIYYLAGLDRNVPLQHQDRSGTFLPMERGLGQLDIVCETKMHPVATKLKYAPPSSKGGINMAKSPSPKF